MQQMLTNIENVGKIATHSEARALELLEKQTKLQEESVNNEKEFLNFFKNFINNANSPRGTV